MDMNANDEVDTSDLVNMCRLLINECSAEELLSICTELALDCEILTIADNEFKTVSLKALKGLFLVGTSLEQGKFPQLVQICEKLRPHIIPKVHRAISWIWQPKSKLDEELIRLIDGILGFQCQSYIPTSVYDREAHLQATQCCCWPLDSCNRGGNDISSNEPLWRLLAEIRKALIISPFPAFAYISDTRVSTEQGVATRDCIVLAPTNDPFDAIRIEKTNDGNCWFGPEEYIRLLTYLDNTFGIDVVSVYYEWVEIQLKRIPQGKALQELKGLLYQCFSTRDYNTQYLDLTPERLAYPILLTCDD